MNNQPTEKQFMIMRLMINREAFLICFSHYVRLAKRVEDKPEYIADTFKITEAVLNSMLKKDLIEFMLEEKGKYHNRLWYQLTEEGRLRTKLEFLGDSIKVEERELPKSTEAIKLERQLDAIRQFKESQNE